MMVRTVFSLVLLIGLSLLLTGCGSNTSKPAETSEKDEIGKALSQLSPEDRKAAEKQKICPVTEEPLGSMGVPKKVKVKDREVFICCEACEKKLKENPEKYLKILDEK